MSDSDTQLIADFIRVVESEDGTLMEVGVVEWNGPATPVIRWKTFRRWRRKPTPQRLDAAQQQALQTARFFKVCRICRDRTNIGHMHDARVCQSCAERELGVVY
jgi:hypothetical protein